MRKIRIGSRESNLALWQTHLIKEFLDQQDIPNEIVLIRSEGDLNLEDPLHQMGTVGLFTRTLDQAIISDKIDLAVHSCKDYPTLPPEELEISSYLKRGDHEDILISRNTISEHDLEHNDCVIATGSLRRKAQWLNRYPHHSTVNLRGNVNTRLKKVKQNNWAGAIMAKAGVNRLNLLPKNYMLLNWMIPAPAQGVVATVIRKNDHKLKEILAPTNDEESRITSIIERSFLRTLEGGCSAPIGAKASISNGVIHFKGTLLDPEGKKRVDVEKTKVPLKEFNLLGIDCAHEVIENGGKPILEKIRNESK